MNKKITIQLILLVVLIILSIIFYNKYFFDQKLENKEITKIEVEEKKKQKDDKKTDNSNIIENLKYTSKDLLGNTYIVEAVSAKFFDKQEKNEVLEEDALSGQVVGIENKIRLSDVRAKIIQKNNNIIYIKSKIADYDKVSNNTIFRDDANILYEEQKIDANLIKLDFLNNFIEILENVHYINENTSVFADKVEIDLVTKRLKISMKEKNDKVFITSKY
tara:strand:+ start:90 stop:746 length:657 start_codon:yes stop_codon:yes gene_type:complete